ncbi:MAG: 3-hydroxyacyl-CoA dehydrogenase family protein, partial [Candidatus Hydrogenedentes bacterium]|nr:3-hydroxyacyl-CoA dehydrogenase family protein [Candidatus Hydrogenedentota bacterium]
MVREIKRVAVLGSGVMGSQIAAHLANCGIPSLMLDIVPPGLSKEDAKDKTKRNGFAIKAKENLLRLKPSPIFQKSGLDLIEIGNLEDDLDKIGDCDWIIEVVKEDPEVKRALFKKVSRHRARGSIVTTNTSGVPLHSLVEVMSQDLRRNFLGTHFFNPPRYLKLVEIIPGPDTSPRLIKFMADFVENVLGKGVVYAKDTPNFVANRILTFASQFIMHEMTKDGLTVEDVDALTGPEIGHAKSATFRTADIVGLD